MNSETDELEVEVDGRAYDAETVSEAMEYTIAGGTPAAVMGELALVDNINDRLRWAAATVYLIALHPEEVDGDDVKAAASSASRQLEQAREMFREFTERWRESRHPDEEAD